MNGGAWLFVRNSNVKLLYIGNYPFKSLKKDYCYYAISLSWMYRHLHASWLNTGSYSFNLLKINNFFYVASWMGVHHLVSLLNEENFLLNYKKKIIFLNTRHGHR